MLFFLAILALAVVSLFTVRAMDIEGIKPAAAPRPPRLKAYRQPASQLLDGSALSGLY